MPQIYKKMKIIIAGAGEVGTFLVEMLTKEQKHDIIIIDSDKEVLTEVSAHYDALTYHGSVTSISLLKELEIDKADLFIAVTSMQETNIIASMLAKKLGSRQAVARIDNDEYIEPEHQTLLRELGVDSMIFPEILATEEIVHYLKHPAILKAVNLVSKHLSIFTIKLEPKNKIIGYNLAELDKKFPDIEARIVAIQRAGKTLIPRGSTVLEEGDIVYIITDEKGANKIYRIIGIEDYEIKNVMILGGSRIGVKLAKRLQKCCYVKLFEKDKEKSLALADELSDTLVIHSEARSEDFLLEEGIEKTDAFIAVTGNSEINMLTCMLAKKLGVKKAVAEVENTDYLELAKKMDIDLIVNKKIIAANYIYGYTINAEVLSIRYFAETDAKVLEFVVHHNAKIVGKPLKDVDFPKQAIIGGVERNGHAFIAVGDTVIQEGDKVVVFSMPEVIEKVAKFFN